MEIKSASYDCGDVDPCSGSGLCGMCDQPVEAHDIGIATNRTHGVDYAYLVHASCLQYSDNDEDEE